MDIWNYFLPTRIIFGRNSLNELNKVIASEFSKTKKIFLVAGKNSMKKQGYLDRLIKILDKYTVVLFDEIEPNPTSVNVENGLEKFKETKCDLIVGLGGGSVLDTGKAISILLNNPGKLEDYQAGAPIPNEAVPFIAIPTTAGTSSEMTVFSIITNRHGKYANKKKSFSDEKMYPKVAIIDPELTFSLPPNQTASTGLDALAHSLESYWSKKKNALSQILALDAIKLIVEYLPKVYHNGQDEEAREKMCLAMLLAGMSFSNSRTSSPHKVSYPITSNYNLPHGAACTITLPYFMEYIGEHKPELLEEIIKTLGHTNYKESVEFLKKFIKDLGMPNRLSDLDIDEEGINFIAKQSYVPENKQDDPVPMNYEQYLEILKQSK